MFILLTTWIVKCSSYKRANSEKKKKMKKMTAATQWKCPLQIVNVFVPWKRCDEKEALFSVWLNWVKANWIRFSESPSNDPNAIVRWNILPAQRIESNRIARCASSDVFSCVYGVCLLDEFTAIGQIIRIRFAWCKLIFGWNVFHLLHLPFPHFKFNTVCQSNDDDKSSAFKHWNDGPWFNIQNTTKNVRYTTIACCCTLRHTQYKRQKNGRWTYDIHTRAINLIYANFVIQLNTLAVLFFLSFIKFSCFVIDSTTL